MLTLRVGPSREQPLVGRRARRGQGPVLLAGGLLGTLRTGRVLDYGRVGDARPRLCGMYLGIMHRMGLKLDHFADASERLAGF